MSADHGADRPSHASPERARIGGPLDAVNDGFHDAYDAARSSQKHEGPVFVVLADELVLYFRGRRSSWSFTPRAYHAIKSVTHAPVALYALLVREGVPAEAFAQLATRVDEALARDDLADLDASTRADADGVLRATRDMITRASALSTRELDAFAHALGAPLLRLARAATALQLSALHAHVEEALSHVPAREHDALEVVVTGAHQARARSLAMQYFRKRLREPADGERRVSYGEGVSDEHAALELAGTRRIDRVLAQAFFGDTQRLQRDVLGDAARDLLTEFEL